MPIGAANSLVSLNNMQPRFDRGYTGHEQMAGFGLINMNGRLYDPYLQRFLSPDKVIQDPLNAQNYNRYSYCLNNPLMYTDPSGWQMAPIDQFWNLGKGHTNQTGFNDFGGYTRNRGGAGSKGYFYSSYNGQYYDSATGMPVSYDEVYNNYILPNAVSEDAARDFISQFFPPPPPAEGSKASGVSSNIQTKPGGDNPNKYVLFLTLKQAEKYINKNKEIYGKEIFFYILKDGNVVVGPWSDADR